MTLCHEVDKGADERVDKDLAAARKVFYVTKAEDRISKYQSGLLRGGSIGEKRKIIEKEPQSYRGVCSSS